MKREGRLYRGLGRGRERLHEALRKGNEWVIQGNLERVRTSIHQGSRTGREKFLPRARVREGKEEGK